jgi:hypothetical protein
MFKSTISFVVWAMLTAALPPSAAFAQGARATWQFGSAPTFSSGTYGTDARTDVLFMPITARRLFNDGDLTFVFPFTCIWGSGGVTVLDGLPVRQEPVRGGTTTTTTTRGDATNPRRGAGTDDTNRPGTSGTFGTSGTSGTTDPTRACGAGDIVVRGRYYLIDERGWAPTIAVRAHIKTPTASAGHGLGTGKPDEGFGIEISRTLPGSVLAMVDGGYTIIGKPAGADFRNTWWYDVGIGKNLAGGRVSLSVFFEEFRAIVPAFTNARDVLAAVQVTGAGGWRVQISGERGLSAGAPDHGFTFGASRRF